MEGFIGEREGKMIQWAVKSEIYRRSRRSICAALYLSLRSSSIQLSRCVRG